MTKPTNTQSEKRKSESLASRFLDEAGSYEKDVVFLLSSSDEGVIRNGGRNGARLAPRSLLNLFKKLTLTERFKNVRFTEMEVSDEQIERADFDLAQKKESEKILSAFTEFPKGTICHIGGGHDHIYPLLKALSGKHKKITVINVDAHADTRTDELAHSGNPFRKFTETYDGDFHLIQVGLHEYANGKSTLIPLQPGEMSIIWRKEISEGRLSSLLAEEKRADSCVVFSLDADALSGSIVPGVSAVNGDGINLDELRTIWKSYVDLPLSHPPVIGIYELNPVYDSLSVISMRTIAGFLFESV
jgi:formiminoglutamase